MKIKEFSLTITDQALRVRGTQQVDICLTPMAIGALVPITRNSRSPYGRTSLILHGG